MLLSREEAQLVFKLHSVLMQFVIDQLQVTDIAGPAMKYAALPLQKRREVIEAFLGRLDLIDSFVAANPANLSPDELDIVSSWRHLVAGRFIALRQLLGGLNFLDDRSQAPHLKLPAIGKALGVAESTGEGKSKTIRDLLGIHQFDHHWTLLSRWESTSTIWFLELNGRMIDIRQSPAHLQRTAFEKGLIPYIPAECGPSSKLFP